MLSSNRCVSSSSSASVESAMGLTSRGLFEYFELPQFVAAFVALATSLEVSPAWILHREKVSFAGRQSTLCCEPRDQSREHLAFEPREEHALQAIIDERFPHQRKQRLHDFSADRAGVFANFPLGMVVHAQSQKVQQVVQVNFPI